MFKYDWYLEVMSPQGPYFVLTTNIPDSKADILIFHSFNIEANCGNGCHNLPQLKLVQYCRFSSGVETNHENSHVSHAKKALEKRRECEPHCST